MCWKQRIQPSRLLTVSIPEEVVMNRKGDGFDQFGNPMSDAFDLGAGDEDRIRGERILMYTPTSVDGDFEPHLKQLAISRNLSMDVRKASTTGKCDLTPELLSSYSQLWYVSDRYPSLTEDQIQMISQYVHNGNGLAIWADNDPYYADANLLAQRIVGTSFSGNKMADHIMIPAEKLAPGHFIEHPLTQGVNNLYEGITICTIQSATDLTFLGQSHDGQICMACFEQDKRRIVLDAGFTKLYNDRFERTAGTARYVRNIAFWLAKGSRGIEYVNFTPGREEMATINPGSVSKLYSSNIIQPSTLSYILSWTGMAVLGLEVLDPQNHIVRDVNSIRSPLRLIIQVNQLGDWKCRVKGITVPSPNFPYVLVMARS